MKTYPVSDIVSIFNEELRELVYRQGNDYLEIPGIDKEKIRISISPFSIVKLPTVFELLVNNSKYIDKSAIYILDLTSQTRMTPSTKLDFTPTSYEQYDDEFNNEFSPVSRSKSTKSTSNTLRNSLYKDVSIVTESRKPVTEPMSPKPVFNQRRKPVTEPMSPKPVFNQRRKPVTEPVSPKPVFNQRRKPVTEPVQEESYFANDNSDTSDLDENEQPDFISQQYSDLDGDFEVHVVEEYKPTVSSQSQPSRRINSHQLNSDFENDSSDDESTIERNPTPKQTKVQKKTNKQGNGSKPKTQNHRNENDNTSKPNGSKANSQNQRNGNRYKKKPKNDNVDADSNEKKNPKKPYYKRNNSKKGSKPKESQ
jgi:hypothetical protein